MKDEMLFPQSLSEVRRVSVVREVKIDTIEEVIIYRRGAETRRNAY
jgi:hypothetical protein